MKWILQRATQPASDPKTTSQPPASPVHIHAERLAARLELRDVTRRRAAGLAGRQRKRLLHRAAAEVDGRHRGLGAAAQLAQQVV